MFKQYAKESDIPEDQREHYVEKDGVWGPEGFSLKSKVDEYRDKNINQSRSIDELRTQLLTFKDIDPVKHSDSLKKLQELENKQLADANEWGVLKANLEQQHSDEIKASNEKTAKVQSGWDQERIGNEAIMSVMKYAMPAEGNAQYIKSDFMKAASIDPETRKTVFLDEKGLKRKNEDGEDLTIDEFAKIYIQGSNLFQKSEGSGALGGSDIPMVAQGQVRLDSVSGRDIPGSMIDDIASGKTTVVD